QSVKRGVHLEQNHPLRALRIRDFQPLESLVFLPQSGVDPAYDVGRYVSEFRQLIQLLQDLMCLVRAPSRCIDLAEQANHGRTRPKIACLSQNRDGWLM